MKVKTEDLIGPSLDWAVARCKGFKKIYAMAAWTNKHGAHGGPQVMVSNEKDSGFDYRPSSNWSQGGPIIDREGIQWARVDGKMSAWSGFDYLEWRRNWELPPQLPQGAGFGTGPTVLSAAMRCFVSSRLGDEVEVPDELMK